MSDPVTLSAALAVSHVFPGVLLACCAAPGPGAGSRGAARCFWPCRGRSVPDSATGLLERTLFIVTSEALGPWVKGIGPEPCGQGVSVGAEVSCASLSLVGTWPGSSLGLRSGHTA